MFVGEEEWEGGIAGPGALRNVEGLKGVLEVEEAVMMEGKVSRLLPSSAGEAGTRNALSVLCSLCPDLSHCATAASESLRVVRQRVCGGENGRAQESGTHWTVRLLRLPSRLSGSLCVLASCTASSELRERGRAIPRSSKERGRHRTTRVAVGWTGQSEVRRCIRIY